MIKGHVTLASAIPQSVEKCIKFCSTTSQIIMGIYSYHLIEFSYGFTLYLQISGDLRIGRSMLYYENSLPIVKARSR